MPVYLNAEITIPDSELSWRFSRSSGPGGQSVNTTDSRVEVVFDLVATRAIPRALADRARARLVDQLVDGTTVVIAASEFRSQLRNRQAAVDRLADLLRKGIAPPPPKRRPTKRTKGSQRRRLDSKKQRSETKRLRRRPDD